MFKLTIRGIDVDLVFSTLPDDLLKNEIDWDRQDLIKGVLDDTQRALNGIRTARFLKNFVPDFSVFRTVLTFVKKWAQKKLIYENVHGYLGGISYAILVANMCHLFPDLDAHAILLRFFDFYANYQWTRPISLCNVVDLGYGFRFWDANKNRLDRSDLMPILTPLYPSMNTAFTVCQSTRDAIVAEFKNANRISLQCSRGKMSWSKLFEPYDVFANYKTFILIKESSERDYDGFRWKSFVESKIRSLVKTLESIQGKLHIRPIPKVYHDDISDYFLIGLKWNNIKIATPIIKQKIADFLKIDILLWPDRTKSMAEPNITLVDLDQIPKWMNTSKLPVEMPLIVPQESPPLNSTPRKRKDMNDRVETPTKKQKTPNDE